MGESKNNPENRKGNTNKDKWVLYIADGARKMCKEVDSKLYDKQGKVVAAY